MSDHAAMVDPALGTARYGPLTDSVRRLIDDATVLLAARTMPGAFGVRRTVDGGTVAHTPDKVYTDVELGAAYEGPPGHVHGGVCAMILDHVLGATAHQPDTAAFTGTLQ